MPVKAPRWRSARAGGAASTLTGHSNEPETGNYVMVPRQVPRPCMALTVSGQDAAMDDMVEPQGARDVLPIPRCRQLLGDEAIDLTDAEIEEHAPPRACARPRTAGGVPASPSPG